MNKGNQLHYWINLDERGEFSATVSRAKRGCIPPRYVYEIRSDEEGEIPEIRDGFMKHKRDVSGLLEHLKEMGIAGPDDTLTIGG